MKAFLRDLLTESERIMLGRRILIARLLLSDATYDEFHLRLGAGHGTIRTVDRWLSDQVPGYEDAIAKMEEEFGRRELRGSMPKACSFALRSATRSTSSSSLNRNEYQKQYYDI